MNQQQQEISITPLVVVKECRFCGSENVERMDCGDWWCNNCGESMETPIEYDK